MTLIFFLRNSHSFADGEKANLHHAMLSMELIHIFKLRVQNIPTPLQGCHYQDKTDRIRDLGKGMVIPLPAERP